MAFNWSTFKTRSLTALVFAAVMLTGLLWNHWSFFVLFSIIHFGCWWEYLKLTEKIYSTSFHPYTKLGLMLMGYGLMLWFCSPFYNINGYGLKENINFFLHLVSGGFVSRPYKNKKPLFRGFLFLAAGAGLEPAHPQIQRLMPYQFGHPAT